MDQNNEEIKNALREFEQEAEENQKEKNQSHTNPQIPIPPTGDKGITFDVDNFKVVGSVQENNEIPGMVKLTMKWLKVNQKIAEYILLTFMIVSFLISFYLFFGRNIRLGGEDANTDIPNQANYPM